MITCSSDDRQNPERANDRDIFLLKTIILAKEGKLTKKRRNRALEMILEGAFLKEQEISDMGIKSDKVFTSFSSKKSLLAHWKGIGRITNKNEYFKEKKRREKLKKVAYEKGLINDCAYEANDIRLDINAVLQRIAKKTDHFSQRFIVDFNIAEVPRSPRQLLGNLRPEYIRTCNQSEYELRKQMDELINKLKKGLEGYQ